MDKQAEITFFDRFGHDHGDYDVLGALAYKRLGIQFARRINPQRGEACVDLGCGTGAFTRQLKSFGLKLTGIDISPKLIEIATAQSEGEQYRVGDIMSTELPDGSFDIIVFSGILHHFPTEELRLTALMEGYRLLRKGGRVFGYDPNLHSPSMWLYRHPKSPFYSSKGKTENEILISSDQLRHEFSKAGFHHVQVEGLSGITFRFIEGSVVRLLLPIYNIYEVLMMLTPAEKALGTFLISSAVK
jgi:SAM-dependent methyltransferase